MTNVIAYSLQVFALVAAAGVVATLCRLRLPSARLRFWQAVLAACLILPLAQPWQTPAVPAPVESGPGRGDIITVAPTASGLRIPWEQIAWWTLIGGAGLRGSWLAAGLWRLRRYKAEARPLYPLPASLEAWRAQLCPHALVCVSARAAGPVTFGLRAPVVLVPPRFMHLPEEAREAVACHEFLHVRRRDWAFTVVEELAAAILWFHPAVWWLMGQLRLSREQAVDLEVVALTGARDAYVHALLAVVGSRLDLAPAPLFLRRRHLVARVGSLLREVSVSRWQLVGSTAVAAIVAAGATWMAMRAFPLRAAPQALRPDAPGVTVQPGQPRLLHRPGVDYPRAALEKRIEGTVLLELSVNQDGLVTDARVLSGPEELRKAALQSVLDWHYAREGAPAQVQAAVEFRLPPEPPPPPPGAVRMGKGIPPPPPAADAPRHLRRIEYAALSPALRELLQPQLARFEGQPINAETMRAIEQAVKAADTHLIMSLRGEPGGNGVTLSLRMAGGEGLAPPPPPPPAPASGEQRIRVGANVQAHKLVEAPKPEYPPLALQARIQGIVRITVVIDAAGSVQNMRVVSGHPLLVPAAMEAVRRYVYKPTLLNGRPVEVTTEVDVEFALPPGS